MRFLTVILLFFQVPGFSQPMGNGLINGAGKPTAILTQGQGRFSKPNGFNAYQNAFIKNIGQYGETMKGHASMGSIKYGFEGTNMLVLFTAKGLIHLHRKVERPSEREEEELERKGISEEEIERKARVIDKLITMEWVGANPRPEIIAEEQTADYHTYGLLKDKAFGYKKITYKNLYPGIDLVYHFTNTGETGFEYSLIVKPGADAGQVKMRYGGDIKKITIDKTGNLVIRSAINGIMETNPVAFSNTGAALKISADEKEQHLYPVSFQQQNNIVRFTVPAYDKTKTLIIDPFVSNTSGLGGTNNGMAKDIDFDYDGNIYVAGGGDVITGCRLSKYDPSGFLLWTFNGSILTPSWTWGDYYGGWVVEKSSGKIFMGQGSNAIGNLVIRLSTAGIYDNYITAGDPNFRENWKMLWSCNSGNPQILIAGGGTNSNINLAICSPPSPTLASSNITGIPTAAQDIADIVIDPLTNDMYTIYASLILTPSINNRIYKNPPPYSSLNIAWNVASGFFAMNEAKNRPYIIAAPGGVTDNSINALAVNSSYLFYWDGRSLRAFNKSNGSPAGASISFTPNTELMQGGIVADECNNIFIGNTNGTIKVYKFDGISFDDAAAPDINISGYPTASVYDLAYDEARRLLYACGNGFVASYDMSSYCAATVYNLAITPDCPSLSVQATINPTPPPGTTLTYVLFIGTTQIASNSTGLFTGLVPGTNYTIKAFLDQACSGIQLIKDFTMDACTPVLSATFINPSCNLPNGSIHATAIYGTPPYQFSKDGITFQSGGIFTGLAPGNYTITVKDALNNITTLNIVLVNSLPLQVAATSVPSSCTQINGSITAAGTGGAAPLKYSIDGIAFQASGIFTGLAPGNYTITVKDTNGCIGSVPVFVDSLNTVFANAGNNITICEGTTKTLAGTSNGTSILWTPSTGLSNPNILTPDASPVITTLYTLTAKTGICKATSTVIVFVNPAPIANAGRDTGICFGKDLQLNGSGGVSYSWTPSTYLSAANIPNPVVQQPNAGTITYHLSVTDANGCNSLKDDEVIVDVSRPAVLFVGNDTSVAIHQPLFLHGIDVNNSGFITYTWSPAYGLNNPFIKDPVAVLDRDMVYTVITQNANGCIATDNIKIKVYEGPEIYVPNAFTPNGDGLNDVLRPIVIGMKEFHYFSVFNNYGQVVYTTSVTGNGWDGLFKSKKQPVGTYVWMAEAIDYRGNKIQRKGSAILIR